MTTKARRAPVGAGCQFPLCAKGASAREESRGIRQRFPYRCNETKTSRTARRRSPWSPRQRHHQSLWQAKTTFVRISCTSCPTSNLAVVASRSIFGKRTRASINRTSHHSRRQLSLRHLIFSQPLATHRAQEHLNLRRLIFPLYCSSSAQEAIHHTTLE